MIVLSTALADGSGARTGNLYAHCTTVVAGVDPKGVYACEGIFKLRDGTLTVQGLLSANVRTSTSAITGGTGNYANAHGVFVSRSTRTGAQDTFTFTQ